MTSIDTSETPGELVRWSYWTPADIELEQVVVYEDGSVRHVLLDGGAGTEVKVGIFTGSLTEAELEPLRVVLAAAHADVGPGADAPTLAMPNSAGQWWAAWDNLQVQLLFTEEGDAPRDAVVSQLLALNEVAITAATSPGLAIEVSAELVGRYPGLTLRGIGSEPAAVRIGDAGEVPGESFVTMAMDTIGYMGRFFTIAPGGMTWAVLNEPAEAGATLQIHGEIGQADQHSTMRFTTSIVVKDPSDQAPPPPEPPPPGAVPPGVPD